MAGTTPLTSQNIVFKRNIRLGSNDAENDESFLENCFHDTGDLDVLKDCNDPRRIIVGRTGTGKTALISQLTRSEDNVINLPPEVLSISHISNSNIIAFFEEVGLKLDQFYVLLWKHIITVELLRKKYNIHDSKSQKTFSNFINNLLADKSKKKALNYIEEFGDKFWEDTQYRVKEITTNIEKQLEGSLGAKAQELELNAKAAKKLSEIQKQEIVQLAHNAVDKIQIRELHGIVNWLAEDVFDDPKQKYFITIDRLDEGWVDEKIKYKLIKALLDTVRSFVKVKPVKIVVAMRSDLLHRVVEQTKGSKFQYEKYESQFLILRWNENQLRGLVEKRINQVYKLQYNKKLEVGLNDILTEKEIDQQKPFKYILHRTFFRPREIIAFLNECIQQAEGKTLINRATIKKAESVYSYKRFRELKTEWCLNYPLINEYMSILEKKPREFKFGNITSEEIDNLVCLLTVEEKTRNDPLRPLASACFDHDKSSETKCNQLPTALFKILYEIGIVGIKQYSQATTRWSFLGEASIEEAELKDETIIKIHPAYWIALGVRYKTSRKEAA